jgi:hypothetical protein
MGQEIDKYKLLGNEQVLIEHEGPVDKQVLLDTLPKIEDALDVEGVSKQKKRKIVNIAIETLQNLQLHSFPMNGHSYAFQPLFIVAKGEDQITITIGNLVANDERFVLEDKINKINSLNDEEIKFLYGVIMKQTVVKFSTKGGAGLGLIDMKKKSGNPLDYAFQQVDDKVSYFNLKVSVLAD